MDEVIPWKRIILWAFVICAAFVGFRALIMPLWFASRTLDVVQQQIDPAELLRKYEWFKDAAAQLDAKVANIKITQGLIDDANAIQDKKDRVDRENVMLWQRELGGMKFSYNQLAAEYNAQMAKINYRFCNVGDLPQGATVPLPRAYKPYQED